MRGVQFSLWSLCALCLLGAEFRTGWVTPLRSLSYVYSQSVYQLVSSPQRALLTVSTFFREKATLQAVNEQLRLKLLEQSIVLNQLNVILAENQSLKALFNQAKTADLQGHLAKVIDMSQDKFVQHLLLNQGANAGVVPGRMVVDVQGMIGIVLEVFPGFSKVALITDASIGIPAVNVRSGFRTIVHGMGSPTTLTLLHVPNTADLEVGDRLETSDLGGHFKAGYPVGEITSIEKDSREAFMKVTVKPIAKLYQSFDVLILDKHQEESQDAS